MAKNKRMKIMIPGAGGRMGRMLVRTLHDDADAELVAASERPGSANIGKDAGELAGCGQNGIPLKAELEVPADGASAVIDFTAPQATLAHARLAARHGIPMVIGTTGFTADHLRELRHILRDVPVVMAANYSVGVNLALDLIEQAAAILQAKAYDAEIFEAHHRHKVDAPSGTALAMGSALARGRGVSLDNVAVYAREGVTGERHPGSIGFSVVRGGNIVGEHKAMFISDEERIEINHIAADRMVFARGAVRAAHWLITQQAGWYDMQDVLGLKR